jgi:hypothetical protein
MGALNLGQVGMAGPPPRKKSVVAVIEEEKEEKPTDSTDLGGAQAERAVMKKGKRAPKKKVKLADDNEVMDLVVPIVKEEPVPEYQPEPEPVIEWDESLQQNKYYEARTFQYRYQDPDTGEYLYFDEATATYMDTPATHYFDQETQDWKEYPAPLPMPEPQPNASASEAAPPPPANVSPASTTAMHSPSVKTIRRPRPEMDPVIEWDEALQQNKYYENSTFQHRYEDPETGEYRYFDEATATYMDTPATHYFDQETQDWKEYPAPEMVEEEIYEAPVDTKSLAASTEVNPMMRKVTITAPASRKGTLTGAPQSRKGSTSDPRSRGTSQGSRNVLAAAAKCRRLSGGVLPPDSRRGSANAIPKSRKASASSRGAVSRKDSSSTEFSYPDGEPPEYSDDENFSDEEPPDEDPPDEEEDEEGEGILAPLAECRESRTSTTSDTDLAVRPTEVINAAPAEPAPRGMQFDEYSMSWVPAKRKGSLVKFRDPVNELYTQKHLQQKSMKELLRKKGNSADESDSFDTTLRAI